MQDNEWLARQFEENRAHLGRVAFRMLGSADEADDAVQEAWLRLSRSDAGVIDNLGAWLTTVVAHICLDMLRTRKTRREESAETDSHSAVADDRPVDPEREAILADTIGPALLLVLDLLTPPERVAFVLHDTFGMPFDEIAPIIERSPAACRQLASRARRRVRGSVNDASVADVTPRSSPAGTLQRRRAADPGSGDSRTADSGRASHEERPTERKIVDAFLAASRDGDFEALMSLLHPDCALRPDEFALLLGSPKRIDGGRKVAEFFNGKGGGAVRATIHGVAGAAWAPNGRVRVAFNFSFRDGKIADIELIADRKRLQDLGVEILGS